MVSFDDIMELYGQRHLFHYRFCKTSSVSRFDIVSTFSKIGKVFLKCILIKFAVETRMPVTLDSQIQSWKFFLLVLENQKRYIWMYFWLKNSRFLAVKFAIQKIELFFYLCYNLHFYTSGSSALGKEGCQISRQTDNSFGRYGTRNTPW